MAERAELETQTSTITVHCANVKYNTALHCILFYCRCCRLHVKEIQVKMISTYFDLYFPLFKVTVGQFTSRTQENTNQTRLKSF